MIKDVIIATLLIGSDISSIIAYKAVKELKTTVEGLKTNVDEAGKAIKSEIRKEIYNLSFMGVRIKQK